MSDDSPPPKPKPGSLRDRIAAFEQKPASNAPPPLAPRPKPGHVQWKPRASSPPPPPINAEGEGAHGPNATDAKESIGVGGMSLKERMAALQGRGGFGAPAPAPAPVPRPAGDKPKWKPPPAPVSPVNEGGSDHDAASGGDSVKSPVSASDAEAGEAVSEVADGEKSSVTAHEGESTADGTDDPEEEERKRRAAIAARMARLGGARIGMGPPVFAPKPRSSTASSQIKEPVESPDEASTSDAPDSGPKIDIPSAPSETSLLSADSGSPARSPPTHMPVPSGPRRAAPPRRRPPKSPGVGSGEPPSLPTDAEKEEDTTPLGTAERDEAKLEEDAPAEKEEVSAEETEEEAAARRKRIADRIAKSGGVNPLAGPQPIQEEEEQEQDHEEAEIEPEAPAPKSIPSEVEAPGDSPAEAESDVEAPPPSESEAEEPEERGEDVPPPPLPPKISSEEAEDAKKIVESPLALPAKTDEPTVPVVDLSKPANVSTTLEDADKHSVDITEAVAEYKDADIELETGEDSQAKVPHADKLRKGKGKKRRK